MPYKRKKGGPTKEATHTESEQSDNHITMPQPDYNTPGVRESRRKF